MFHDLHVGAMSDKIEHDNDGCDIHDNDNVISHVTTVQEDHAYQHSSSCLCNGVVLFKV